VLGLLAYSVAALVLLYLGVLVVLWCFQERVVFQPPSGAAPSDVDAAMVQYQAADGTPLFAYVVGELTSSGPVMLAFHGNADLSRWLVPWAANVLRETGCSVMLPEYRGYDALSGAPNYRSSALDAHAALEYLRDVAGVAPERLVYFGHSLGTAIAAELAATDSPQSLILQSPFSTARAMAARMFVPGLTMFWRLVSRVHFDTLTVVRTLACPVWVAHGDRDTVVPVRMGREVFAAARRKGELLIVHGASHSNVADVGGVSYWNWLSAAIRGCATPAIPGGREGTPPAP
jgi:uncharacterized protein